MLILMLILNFSCYFTKNRFYDRLFPSDFKKSLNIQGSICSGVCLQHSSKWYIEQIKLLKMLNFRRLSNKPR